MSTCTNGLLFLLETEEEESLARMDGIKDAHTALCPLHARRRGEVVWLDSRGDRVKLFMAALVGVARVHRGSDDPKLVTC